MTQAIHDAILACISAHNGSATWEDIRADASVGLSAEDASIGIVGALLQMVNDGTAEAGVYFARTEKGHDAASRHTLHRLLPVFAMYGEWITAPQVSAVDGSDAAAVATLLHALWWEGYLVREYRYAMPSSLPGTSPQESIHTADTTPPLPAG